MKNSSKLNITTHDLPPEISHHHPFSSFWTGPSSPPFHHPQPAALHSPLASSPSSPSEFEFGSIASLEIHVDLPASPKLIPTPYWGTAVPSYENSPPPNLKHTIPPPPSHPIPSTQHPSSPPSTSVRQLMAEEMCSEQHVNDLDLDFYTASQTPLPAMPPRKSTPDLEEKSLSQDDPLSNIAIRGDRRKSNSTILDRHVQDELAPRAKQKNQPLQSSKSESNSHFALWTSSFAWEKSEDEKSGGKKQGSKSGMKWAFKDLLRRTVPSSKAEAHYITKTMGTSSSKKYLSSIKSSPNINPLASPMHSTSKSTSQSSRASTPGRSGSSTPARSPPRYPSTPGHPLAQSLNQTPAPSPPRSPLSAHAIHYQQNKAQSLELTRKTFLPYRQSLLGCLGGPSAFPPEQQAW